MVIAIIVILVIAVICVLMYNGLVKSSNTVEEAFSTMDVYLKKRSDLIPNVVETVKGYAKHEQETLEMVIAKRNEAKAAGTPAERMEKEAELGRALQGINVLAEAYPDLKANTNFQNLQDQLAHVEEDIANARTYYNGAVKIFNNKVMTFPGNIFAGLFHFEKKAMFEVADAAERENVKVSF